MEDKSINIFLEREDYTHTPGEIAKSIYYYVQNIGYYCCGSEHRTFRSGMESILLFFCIAGNVVLHYRNKKYVIKEGDFFIINCKDIHDYSTSSNQDWQFKFLHFKYGKGSGTGIIIRD